MKRPVSRGLAVVAASLVLLAVVSFDTGRKAHAAGDGKITGTVKLDGTAPHMKPIDMSKDPYCSKAHASDPAAMQTVVVGKDGSLANVVLYISEGLSGDAASAKATAVPVFDQNTRRTYSLWMSARNSKFRRATRRPTTSIRNPIR
jgi:hypothetical protein